MAKKKKATKVEEPIVEETVTMEEPKVEAPKIKFGRGSLNEIGECDLELDQDIAFEAYAQNKQLGSFIVVDRVSNNTVAMGLIESAKDTKGWVERHVEQRNKYWVRSHLTSQDREKQLGHKPLFVLLTGNVEKAIYSEYEKELEKKRERQKRWYNQQKDLS